MRNKTVNLVVNIIVGIIFVLILFITINILVSRGKGYTPLFGTASVAVKSDSMEGDQETSFKKGDLIFVKILKEDEKTNLKVGDVIMYYDRDNNGEVNTHRIVALGSSVGMDGYQTLGDKPGLIPDAGIVKSQDVIGVYSGSKIGGIGNMFLFFQTSTGFLVCVVVPAVLLVGYCVYELIRSLIERNKLKLAAIREEDQKSLDDERERMRAELMAELEAKNAKNSKNQQSEQKSDKSSGKK